MTGVYAHWQPLDRDDVFVNALGRRPDVGRPLPRGGVRRPLGLPGDQRRRGDARTSTPTGWASSPTARSPPSAAPRACCGSWFAHARDAGIPLPALRKVLWLGEAWHPQLDDDLAAVAPQAQRWGMFGSTETWVVGTNTPRVCRSTPSTPLPEQLVHVGDDTCSTSPRLNPDMLNPVLRYQTGDAGELVACPCGRPDPAMRILGPSRLRRPGPRPRAARGRHRGRASTADPGVARAQVLITEQRGRVSGCRAPGAGRPRDADP